MPNMIYRSPATRWCLAIVGVLAGLTLTVGDAHKWRDTPSLHWLAGFHVPLQLWGCLLFVYAAMLISTRFRPAGFLLGAGLYALFAVSLLATLGDGGPKNAMALAGIVDVVVFHLYAVMIAYDDPRRARAAK